MANTVQSGENLSTIAQNAGLTPEQFATLNPSLANSSNSYQGLNNNVAVGTAYNLSAPASTTVVSNENKVNTANNIIQKQQGYQSGPVTTVDANGNTITTLSDGSVYEPTPAPAEVVKGQGGYYKNVHYFPGAAMPTDDNGKTVTLMDKPENYIDLNSMKAQFDANGVKKLSNIENTYNNLIKQQEQANAAGQAGTTAYMVGGGRGVVSSDNVMSQQISYGLQQIATLNAQKEAAIIAAESAIQAVDFQYAQQMQKQSDKIAKRQQDAMDKINNDLIDAQKKVAENTRLVAKENIISDLYNKGFTDPSTVISKLKAKGVKDITAKEVSDTLALISGKGGTGDIGDYNMYRAQTLQQGLVPLSYLDFKDQQDAKTARLKSSEAFNNAYNAAAGKASAEAKYGSGTGGGSDNVANPTSGSILGVTGLSAPAFAYATLGSAGLTRFSQSERTKAMNEWKDYQIKNNIDGATFKSQYEAYNNTVKTNVMRNNQANVAQNELMGTIANLRDAATAAGLSDLKGLNIAKIFAGSQLNKADQQTFKIHLTQLRNELAMYNAATAGQLNSDGSIRETKQAEMDNIANNIIQDGFANGSIDGFEKAINASKDKLGAVLKDSISTQNKQVWDLFGVGDKYQAPVDPVEANNKAKEEVAAFLQINGNTKVQTPEGEKSLWYMADQAANTPGVTPAIFLQWLKDNNYIK